MASLTMVDTWANCWGVRASKWVKSKRSVRSEPASRLLHVVAQHLPQSRIQQVGRGGPRRMALRRCSSTMAVTVSPTFSAPLVSMARWRYLPPLFLLMSTTSTETPSAAGWYRGRPPGRPSRRRSGWCPAPRGLGARRRNPRCSPSTHDGQHLAVDAACWVIAHKLRLGRLRGTELDARPIPASAPGRPAGLAGALALPWHQLA